MVATQLANRGVYDRRVLAAMAWVPREWFLPPHLTRDAYDDGPLPIGSGQTISQPLIVALMTQALAPRRGDRVLEVGTGSGYQTAVLAHLGARVFTDAVREYLAAHPNVVDTRKYLAPGRDAVAREVARLLGA